MAKKYKVTVYEKIYRELDYIIEADNIEEAEDLIADQTCHHDLRETAEITHNTVREIVAGSQIPGSSGEKPND